MDSTGVPIRLTLAACPPCLFSFATARLLPPPRSVRVSAHPLTYPCPYLLQHFGWDATLEDGIRYIQAPLSYPEERQSRLGSVATGEDFPHGNPTTPLLVYDARCRSFPPRYDAGWSNFYARYPRRADLCHILAPYVAAQGYEQVAGVGEVGWFGDEVDPFTGEPMEEPLPAWRLGPRSAVDLERSKRLANPSVYAAMGGEVGRSPSGSPTGSWRRRMTNTSQ